METFLIQQFCLEIQQQRSYFVLEEDYEANKATQLSLQWPKS